MQGNCQGRAVRATELWQVSDEYVCVFECVCVCLCVFVSMCVCVCVCEREKKRKRLKVSDESFCVCV